MLTDERQNYILNQLKRYSIVKSQDLMKATNASESTIRRDLKDLEAMGACIRVFGGAKRVDSALSQEAAQPDKYLKNTPQKMAIAKLAVEYISANSVIYLDAGTTTQAMINLLDPTLNITVVTNGVDTASLLADQNIHTILLGGILKNSTKAIVGALAIKQLENYQFDAAFLGTNAIHLQAAFTTPDPEEAAIKQMALQHSSMTFILADNSKFNQRSFSKFADFDQVTILTNQLPPNDARNYSKLTNLKEVKI